MQQITFGDLIFTVVDDGRVLLTRCYGFDTSHAPIRKRVTFCEVDLAGGATCAWNRLSGSDETKALRYHSHGESDGTLTLIQRSERLEVFSLFRRYDDTDALRIVQTVRNLTSEPLSLELANTFGLCFSVKEEAAKDWYFHKFTNTSASTSSISSAVSVRLRYTAMIFAA